MRSRSIRRALKERAFRKDYRELVDADRQLKLGQAQIEPDAVVRRANLERAVGDWFVAQLPKRASTTRETEALAPLLKTLQDVHDDHEYQRLRMMTPEKVVAKYGA